MYSAEQILPNSIRIDSLRIRIPLTEVTILDNSLFDIYSELNESTGEVDTDSKKQKAKIYKLTESTTVKMEVKRAKVTKDTHEDCIIILAKSKLLKADYFAGINALNIHELHESLMGLRIFDISFNKFIRCDCTDIDIKHDVIMTLPEWKETLKELKNRSKQSKKFGEGYKLHYPTSKKPLQMGLQYSRRGQGTIQRPYLKLYWKGGELLSESIEFYNEHLKQKINESEVERIFRIEATIKNREHAQKLGLDNPTLINLIKLTDDELTDIFQQIIFKHIEERPKSSKASNESKLTADKIIHLQLIKSALANGRDINQVIEDAVRPIQSKQTRSRKRKELKTLYTEYLQDFEFTSNISDKVLTVLRRA